MTKASANNIKMGLLGDRRLLKVKIMEYMVKGCARHAGAIFAVVEQLSFGRSVLSSFVSWVWLWYVLMVKV